MQPSKRTVQYYLCTLGTVFLLFKPMLRELLPANVEQALFFLGIFFLLIYAFSVCNQRFQNKSLGILWVIFLCYLAANILFIGKADGPGLTVLVGGMILFILPFNTNWIKPVLRALVFITLFYAVATITLYIFPDLYQPIKNLYFLESDTSGFQSGLTAHYSINGSFISLGLITVASFLLSGEIQGRKKALIIILVLIFAFALLLTAKRAHLIFALTSLLLIYWLAGGVHRLRNTVLVGIGLFAGGTILALLVPEIGYAFNRIFQVFAGGVSLEEATSGRPQLWANAIEQWRSNPIFGIGWDNFIYVWMGGWPTSVLAHNEFLHLLVTIGLVGCILFVACAIASYVLTINTLRKLERKNPLRKYLLVSCVVQTFTLLYGFTTGDILPLDYVALPYFLSVAIALAINQKTGIRSSAHSALENKNGSIQV